jgi:Zn-finger nucleic acid-binding protein
VVIDHCPSCGGIWLDKGELGKFINQMKEADASLDDEFRSMRMERRDYHDRDYDKGHYEKNHYKKKSRLGKLFDIFD